MNKVSQNNIKAGGPVAGRDINTHYLYTEPRGTIEKLLFKLKQQFENDEKAFEIIDELARYHKKRSIDGIDGLEAKLKISGRSESYLDAIEKKEMFSKLIEKWSLYDSAQQIFVHILAKAESEFNSVVYLEIPNKSEAEINAMILEKIIDPIVSECGSEFFNVNHNVIQGMIYWLAEQCFIRWHHSKEVVS